MKPDEQQRVNAGLLAAFSGTSQLPGTPSLAAVFVGHVYGIDGRHVSST
jgi:hypothetical protein